LNYYNRKRFYPKKPVKTFQDLDVYQQSSSLAVAIAKNITVSLSVTAEELVQTALNIPKLLATAHSIRFGRTAKSIDTLEEAMLSCNLVVVYLEQYRDLDNPTKDEPYHLPADFFDTKVKEYLRLRTKIMRLQKAWLKFVEKKQDN